MNRDERCEVANRMLFAIASCGRKFFRHGDRVSRFEVDGRGRIWFVDSYSGRRIYTHYRYDWRGFTNGGTMRRLCDALRDYIRCGTLLSPAHFGPWPEWVCGGDLWGYGDAAQNVREQAERLGIIRVQVPMEVES